MKQYATVAEPPLMCLHCGRPIGGAAVWIGAGAYHVECTQSPYAAPSVTSEYDELYDAVNELMAHIGAYGEVDTQGPLCERVMNALYDIDGGVYTPRTEGARGG